MKELDETIESVNNNYTETSIEQTADQESETGESSQSMSETSEDSKAPQDSFETDVQQSTESSEMGDTSEATGQSGTVQDQDTESESMDETVTLDSENLQTDIETEDTELLETDESQSETKMETETETNFEEDLNNSLPEMIANSIQAGIPQVMSLLPLEETKAYLILNDYSEEDLKQVPLETILNNLQYSDGTSVYIDPESKIVWTYFKDEAGNIIQDEYHEIGRNEIVDLSQFQNSTGYTLELIVGNGKQLDPNNKRYIITVYISNKYSEKLEFELYTQNPDASREKVNILSKHFAVSDSNIMGSSGTYIPLWGYYYVCSEGEYIQPYISVSSLLDQRPDVDVVIYKLDEYLQNSQSGHEIYPTITDKILNQDMSVANSGYKIDRTTDSGAGEVFIFLYYINGIQLDATVVEFLFGGQTSSLEGDIFDLQDSNKTSIVYQTNVSFSAETNENVDIYEYVLQQGFSANREYRFALNAISGTAGNVNEHITKVVEGHYNSLAEASNLPDIKDLLLGDEAAGYEKDYSNGVDFTIFFDDSVFGLSDVYQFTIRTKEYNDVWMDYTDAPIVGAQDPWFRVTGASTPDGGTLDTYVVENGKEINMDTMYGYGYQTIFIYTENEKEDISAIVPTFDMADSENVKVTSIHINDGQTYNIGEAIPCPTDETTVTFHVTIEDENGLHTKNYNVSFIKRSSGPKLYVTDPKGDNGVRSVFLDEYFEYKHDIFIANMGSEPLTGLRVELNATHVKLDDYWTIGGEGNDTLAPFDTTAVTTEYGELPNIAKIRLLPDGEGEIEGTITIYADGQEPVTIQLSGRAMNPEIITSSVEDAVKFVPYSYMISTNNMYDWTDVTFTMEGELPEGVEFIESTGEIYGVPRETGEFPLSVTAEFTSDTYDFESSTIEFTLTVQDNSNENVYNATDDQYQILDPIGEDVDGNYDFVLTETGDQMFVSNGEFDEFVDLWLNGEKLIEGQDYTKEAGSTRITIQSQIFEDKANSDGSNTIAAEFRVDGDSNNELRRTAQNFRLDIQQEPSTGGQPSTDETQRPAETTTPSTDRPPVQDETQRPTETTTPSTDTTPAQDETQRPADTENQRPSVNPDETDTSSTSAPNTDQRPSGDENQDVDDTQANGSTGNSDGDANANTSANTNTNANAGESGSESYNSSGQSDSANSARYVSFNVELVDEENVPLEDYIVEVHSQPQSTRTDSHGNAVFSKVEFGGHTLIVKDGDSNTLASKDFELRSGNSVSISGTIITAAGGSDVTLKVRLEDGQLVFLNATASVARTGDAMMPMLWIGICLVSGFAVLGCCVYITKKRRYRR
ncbi:hypothetical protein HNP82_001849 [Catenibacillus scindens]|uniref:Uncharacterized protein n=1 Tax=Catenibacillus scindens TaxID=673271 RepID=A0A7W8HA47_9FIRM|nr:hypothetical protein [Catenibacillus scindens]MBB5264721.1 hypothetical protein [Catenibacillus scindens]